jgi:hypothetical protein
LRFGNGETDADPRLRELPIILVTGQVSRAELARGMDAGLDDFVPKPVDLDEFRSRVRAVVRRAQASARPRTRTQGDLTDLGISALSQALHLSGGSVRLCIRSGTAHSILDFHRGQISHASYTAQGYQVQGDEAALLILALAEGSFEIETVPQSSPRTVFMDTQSVLLRSATQADESSTAAIQADDAAAVRQDEPLALFDVAVAPSSPVERDTASVEFDLDDEPSHVAV